MLNADAILNLIALFGVFSAFALGLRSNQSNLDNKLSMLYFTLTLFLLTRQIFYWFNYPIIVKFIMASGAILPLMTLLVSEEILRRHSPILLKRFIFYSAIFFFSCAFLLGSEWPIFWLTIFAIYCVLSLLFIVLFLVKNRKNQNAPFETKMVDSFIIAIFICSLLIITEFRALLPNLAIGFGAIGILIFVNTTLSLSLENASPGNICIDILALMLSAFILLCAISCIIPNIDFRQSLQIFTCALAIKMASLGIYRNIESILLYRKGKEFIDVISNIEDDADLDQVLMAHQITSTGKIHTENDLQFYGSEIIQNFLKQRVISRETFSELKTSEALANLFDENGANYLLRLSVNPIKFLTIATGTIGNNKKLEAELRILTIISERAGNVKAN